jgi:Na+/H+ antiporter NhaC
MGPVDPNDPILLATIGAVLAGSIFGDHCSPISDTTVLSSMASSCDHLDHVATQMGYALVVAAVSVVFGYLPAGFGLAPRWALPLASIALLGILFYWGRRVDGPPRRGGGV